jgi:hypothetical protein
MPDLVYELLATELARDKLAARGITPAEVEQVPRNLQRIVRNPHGDGAGQAPDTDRRDRWRARLDTLVIERTVEPTTWLVVTGWSATAAERNLLGG